MFYIAVGEAYWSKCAWNLRNVLNSKGMALRSGPRCSRTLSYRDYCRPDGAAVEIQAGAKTDLMSVFTG
jgi:hypothetical protein